MTIHFKLAMFPDITHIKVNYERKPFWIWSSEKDSGCILPWSSIQLNSVYLVHKMQY